MRSIINYYLEFNFGDRCSKNYIITNKGIYNTDDIKLSSVLKSFISKCIKNRYVANMGLGNRVYYSKKKNKEINKIVNSSKVTPPTLTLYKHFDSLLKEGSINGKDLA